ncbi:hypothetical protein [Candidatus Poriferisodalis sp.]|uniref:hypothetical protein n=1 Tax=Candidatus Poriferisodalis sp. TaxID=3101277 RepID=UPI003B020DE0
MSVLVLDSGAVSHLARGGEQALSDFEALVGEGLWPPVIPTVVLAECLSGRPQDDVVVEILLKSCSVLETVTRETAKRAGELRRLAGRGSAVDAVVVAMAEPAGTILTDDLKDLAALAQQSDRVSALPIKSGRGHRARR